jgi:carbon monoxide dehydrogenase subunit G
MAILGVVVLLAGTVIGVVYFSDSGNSSVPSALDPGGTGGAKRTVSAPLDNRTSASFDLLAAVGTVHVSIGELGDDLYQISTPDDAGIKPSPVIKVDDVQLQVTKDGDGAGNEIDVVLSAAVRWQLRFTGYADQQQIDLSAGDISSVEMIAGMHTAELELPTPDGTVPVKITGKVDQLTVRSPANSPVRVKTGGGATNVVAGSRTIRDMPAGSTLTPKDWKAQTNRYDVTASSTIGSLNVENLTQ